MIRGCRYKMFDFTNVCSISTVILNLYTNKKWNSFLIFFFEVDIVPKFFIVTLNLQAGSYRLQVTISLNLFCSLTLSSVKIYKISPYKSVHIK